MPLTHVVSVNNGPTYTYAKNADDERPVEILDRDVENGRVYIHFVGMDKRLDEWVDEELVTEDERPRKRTRTDSPVEGGTTSPPQEGIIMTEEDFDIQHHKKITAQRNFDKVQFGDWQMKTWYFSPYPLIETEDIDIAAPLKIPGVHRTTSRSHGRTLDIFAGGLGRSHGTGEKAILWVCEMCFKYMTDGLSWELHQKSCQMRHPPGTKVYQRGAHTIWEVDGAKAKLYCQNLSLFGKLFIDIKTLFFDCDNFMFYILTDATSTADHVLGFFSKEKVSYDDYNLACIITLPPYQRKGYGILLIEFSYELSRRAGKVGTPERPLSDLGLRSYLAYWVSTLIRFFRRVLSVLPPNTKELVEHGTLLKPRSPSSSESPEEGVATSTSPRKKKKNKGWDGEVDDDGGFVRPDEEEFSKMRMFVTTPNPDGSAHTRIMIRCTLADISKATNLRMDDAAFALNEVGLLASRLQGKKDPSGKEMVVITREMVEQVARDRKVKMPCMRMKSVLL